MTTAYFLIGLPASGKTTWRSEQNQIFEQSWTTPYAASSDDFIERWAASEGKTYNDVFREAIKPADHYFNTIISEAVTHNKDLIIDRTNLSVESRRKILCRLPFDWKKIALVFKCKDFDEWKKRLMSRPGKTIPVNVIQDMIKRFEHPTFDEGFDSITKVFT